MPAVPHANARVHVRSGGAIVIVTHVQRWLQHRAFYRPAREVVDVRRLEVAILDSDATARAFVEAHHYSASYPAARLRFGLYERSALVGVAVLSHPMREDVLSWLPGEGLERAELGRFVLLDRVGANAETWFLARAFDLARRAGIVSALSMSDPEPRSNGDGTVVFPGHVGTIYQASNAVYRGRAGGGAMRTVRLFRDGTMCSARALQKIRARDRGWRYAVELLRLHGARAPVDGEDLRAWLRAELPRITTTHRRAGNHVYGFALERAARRARPA